MDEISDRINRSGRATTTGLRMGSILFPGRDLAENQFYGMLNQLVSLCS